MGASRNEVNKLMWEHKAISAHMKFLTDSLRKMTVPSSQGTAQSDRLQEQIRLYRWSLYDFREAIRRHIDLDERIFAMLLGRTSVEDIMGEHETIQKQLDNAISLAENAVYNKLRREELNKCASDITGAVSKICESIGAHMAKEDRLLKLLRKDS